MQVSLRFFGNQRPMQNPNVTMIIDDTSKEIVTIHGDKLRLDGEGKFSGAEKLGRKDFISSLLATGLYFSIEHDA
jgi:hypothetical protein